ncbi:MAG: IPTL-CTERM sorting domain-containing protein [candidate division Zixibacteria bacterium]
MKTAIATCFVLLMISTGYCQGVLVFGEDWESGTIDPGTWTQDYAGGFINNDSHQGSYAVNLGTNTIGIVSSNVTYSFADMRPLIDFWVKTTSDYSVNNFMGIYLADPVTDNPLMGISIYPASGQRELVCVPPIGSGYSVPYPVSEDGDWHHYVANINEDNTISFYKDENFIWQSDPYDWGGYYDDFKIRFTGRSPNDLSTPTMDDFQLYDQDGANVPTLSEWGMLIMGLLLLVLGTVAVVRRKRGVLSKV